MKKLLLCGAALSLLSGSEALSLLILALALFYGTGRLLLYAAENGKEL